MEDPVELAIFLKVIGDNFYKMRVKAKKDIETISKETGIPFPDLLRIEAGDSAHQNAEYILALSKYFKVHFSKFWEGY